MGSVRELVRFESKLGLNGDLVLPTLASAYLVEDDAAAERLASAYPDCHFLTATGAHYHHRLVSGGKGSSAGPWLCGATSASWSAAPRSWKTRSRPRRLLWPPPRHRRSAWTRN